MRRTVVSVMASAATVLVIAAPAAASYDASSAPLLWEQQAASNGTGVDVTNSAAILDATATLTSCDDTNGDQLCRFGRPAISPDAGAVIVSRHPTTSGAGTSTVGPGTLMLIGANGADPRMLSQLTASDTQPAFLPGGQRIVFTGRTTLSAASQLYEANIDGSGLRRLTSRGGSWAAPCANGAIVFQRGANLWLIPAHGSHWTALVRGGSQPDCAPDSLQVVYVPTHTRTGTLALIGLDGTRVRVLPHGHGAEEESDRPGRLSSPAFSPDGRDIAYLRTYDVGQQDGSRNELDVADLSGRILARRDIADQSFGSIGSDAEQSITQYVGW